MEAKLRHYGLVVTTSAYIDQLHQTVNTLHTIQQEVESLQAGLQQVTQLRELLIEAMEQGRVLGTSERTFSGLPDGAQELVLNLVKSIVFPSSLKTTWNWASPEAQKALMTILSTPANRSLMRYLADMDELHS